MGLYQIASSQYNAIKKKKSYMREGMGRPGFTLFGVGKASVGIVHPAPVIILAKLEHTGHCLQTA